MRISSAATTVMALFGLLSSCKVTGSKESSNAPISKLLISVNQGSCQGKCQQFEAAYFSGQKMVYNGNSRMPLLGKYEFFIPEQLPGSLIAEALKLNLSSLPDSISSPDGEQRIKILFLLNTGKMKSVSAGASSGPDNFRSFVKFMNSEVRSMIEDQQGVKID